MNIDAMKTIDELVTYAEGIGLEVPGEVKTNYRRLLSFIKQAIGADDVSDKPQSKGSDRVKIIIQTSDTDMQPVPVGINGYFYAIKRGEEVAVPYSVVEVLNQAIKKVPLKDRNGRITGWKEAQMYPFSIVPE